MIDKNDPELISQVYEEWCKVFWNTKKAEEMYAILHKEFDLSPWEIRKMVEQAIALKNLMQALK